MNNGWHLERFNTLMMILAVTGYWLWPAMGYNRGPLLRATANDIWHLTFDISWHLTFSDIWHFVTFEISCQLRFNLIWRKVFKFKMSVVCHSSSAIRYIEPFLLPRELLNHSVLIRSWSESLLLPLLNWQERSGKEEIRSKSVQGRFMDQFWGRLCCLFWVDKHI